jgi:tetratricopeptide (TPR) repeat protein
MNVVITAFVSLVATAAAPAPVATANEVALPRSHAALAESVMDTARLQERRGRWEQALGLVEAALQNVDAAEPKWAARLAVRRGALLIVQARRKTGDWDRAIAALEAAVGQARAAQDSEALGSGLDQLGLALHHKTLFTRQGNYATAEQALAEALRVRKAARVDPGVADVLFHLGLCAEHGGQRDAAFDMYRRSLAIAARARYEEGISQAHRHLGSLYEDSREWPRALEHYQTALAATRRAGDQLGIAPSLSAVADAMIAAGSDPAEPRRLLEEALAHATELNDLAYVAHSRLSLGRLAQAAAQQEAAAAHLREALRAADAIGDGEISDEARKRLADLGVVP